MKIKDWCCDEQPREKMLAKGAAALSNSELLAILLRTGDSRHNVVDVCRDLLKQADGRLRTLSEWSVEKLQTIDGIGPTKALTVAATFELARRWFAERPDTLSKPILSSEDAWLAFGPKLKGLGHEEAWMMLLNRAGIMVGLERISTGGLTSTTMETRGIVKRALEKNATSIIIAHNHPSGNPKPGKADRDCTEKLKNALTAFDIQLLDHLIIGEGGFYSFSDECIHPITVPCGGGRLEC